MSRQHHDPGEKKRLRNIVLNPTKLTKTQRRAIRNGEKVNRTPIGERPPSRERERV